MRLFSNGCSFLGPRPKDNVNNFVTKDLAHMYKDDLINLAMGGRGNDRISFTTKLWFYQNQSMDVFAVIGWSSSHRHDYLTNDGWKKGRIPGMDSTWRTWKTADNLKFVNSQLGYDIDQQAEMRFLDHVIDVQTYFEHNRIPYVMYNALPNKMQTKNNDLLILKTKIDSKRFFKIDSSHYDYVMDNKMIVSPKDPHPNSQGHREWANQLKEFIDVNNLRTI